MKDGIRIISALLDVTMPPSVGVKDPGIDHCLSLPMYDPARILVQVASYRAHSCATHVCAVGFELISLVQKHGFVALRLLPW